MLYYSLCVCMCGSLYVSLCVCVSLCVYVTLCVCVTACVCVCAHVRARKQAHVCVNCVTKEINSDDVSSLTLYWIASSIAHDEYHETNISYTVHHPHTA